MICKFCKSNNHFPIMSDSKSTASKSKLDIKLVYSTASRLLSKVPAYITSEYEQENYKNADEYKGWSFKKPKVMQFYPKPYTMCEFPKLYCPPKNWKMYTIAEIEKMTVREKLNALHRTHQKLRSMLDQNLASVIDEGLYHMSDDYETQCQVMDSGIKHTEAMYPKIAILFRLMVFINISVVENLTFEQGQTLMKTYFFVDKEHKVINSETCVCI